MARKRLPMSQVKEILRLLRVQKQSVRATSRALGVSVGVVSKVSNRATSQGLTWAMASELSEAEVAARLYGRGAAAGAQRPEPDPVAMHKALMGLGVTLELLHLEYLAEHPTGLKYTAFCDRYRKWKKRCRVTMRQPHKVGENASIDFSGKRPHYFDTTTGDRVDVELFVSVLGASNLTFAVATASQQVDDFIRANVLALEYFEGVPKALVPDRLKSAVLDSDPFDPTIQRAFFELANHYGTAVVPARPGKSRDKAKVEGAVLIAQRWILARLRHEMFFSLRALNRRIAELLEDLNGRPMKKLGNVSRRELFEEIERAALGPLPEHRFESSRWLKVRAGVDYHVTIDEHHYSVPYVLTGELLEARLAGATIELFYMGQRVAAHPASRTKHAQTTDPQHMPRRHREWAQRDPQQLLEWACEVGPATAALMRRVLERNPVVLKAWRSGSGLKKLADRYGAVRLEEACRRALLFGAQSYRPVERMLRTGLDERPLPDAEPEDERPIAHDQVRGPDYYLN